MRRMSRYKLQKLPGTRTTSFREWQPISVQRPLSYFFTILIFGITSATGQTHPQDHIISASKNEDYRPITGHQRLYWIAKSTVGPVSLAGGLFTAGFSTAHGTPHEYGTHWDGFGRRYGMRLTGISTGNVIEAGLGSLWGEDPRYFRAAGQPFKNRVKNIVVMTFAARRTDGDLAPAYARYIGKMGSNFLSNTWRPDSVADWNDACIRTVLGFVGRVSSNAFAEFWPDARKHLFHKKP